ncbi:MAG: DUF2341 domain-containing protein, partial [Patescibacteria group bacterium]|nr:DUF2341 domain-containing protein [Patescibacteria group bacterium]
MKLRRLINFCLKQLQKGLSLGSPQPPEKNSKRTDPIGLPLFRRKKFLIALFTLIFISIPIAFLSLNNARKAVAAWFDDSWLYRKAISIPSHTAAETNVYVTVPSFDATDTTRFQADCGDLRFTKQNGELLPYYVVDCDATANIHVQFDTLPAGASTYYMYYGNPSADNGFSAADFSTAASGLGTQTFAAEEKSAGPVAYWKFDEGYGTTANDSTRNANTGSLGVGSSAPVWTTEDQCISGKCLWFDGSNDYVNAGNPSSLNLNSPLTISAWVKIQSAKTHDIVGHGDQGFLFYITNTNYVKFGKQNVNGVSSTSSISLNQWAHISAVYNGSTVTFYINGVAAGSPAYSSSFTNSNNLWIGSDSANPTVEATNGFIDDVKIYPYARTAAQIKSDYAAKGSSTSKGTSVQMGSSAKNSDALSNGLVGYWKMDESASPAVDSSGNGNSGTWAGNAAVTAGKFSNGISLDGTGDWVSVGSVATYNLAGGNFTLCSWFKTSGTEEDILANGVSTDGNYLLMSYLGKLRGHVWYSGNSNTIDSTATVNDGNWHHGCQTVDSSNIYLYVDGVLDKTQALSGTKSGITGTTVIGSRQATSASYNYNGSLDETRIYNRALSGKEVRDLYSWAPGPVGYWNMDEKTGTTANDISGNGLTGTLGVGNSAPSWTNGKFGGALSFDGTNDYVNMGTLSQTPRTVSYWIKPTTPITSSSPNYSLMDFGNVNTYDVFGYTGAFTGDFSGETITWASEYTPTFRTTYITNTIDTNWHHLAITNNGTVWNQVYLDGVAVTTNLYNGGAIVWNNGFTVGKGYWNSDGFFNGSIDDVRIYNYARSPGQIVEDMNAGHPSVGSPVGSAVGYWKFDEGYGSTANNSGFGGTALNGSLGVGTSAPSWSNAGKFGKALSFDGNDYNDVTYNSTLAPTAEITVSGWFYRTNWADSVSQVPVSKTQSGGYEFYLTGNNMKIQIYRNGSYGIAQFSTSALSGWNHFVGTYDGRYTKIYINGILKNTDDASANYPITYSVSNSLIIGAEAGAGAGADGYGWTGLLDEVKVYNYALTEDEIRLDYNRGSAMVLGSLSDNSSYEKNAANQEYCVPGDTTSCAAPVAEWKMDEKTGGYTYDTSGNGNTGTWNGTGSHWATGKIGASGQFNGSDDYVSVSDSNSLDVTSISIETWIKPSNNWYKNIGTNPGLIHKYGSSAGYLLYLENLFGTVSLYVPHTNTYLRSSERTWSAGSWYHVVATYDGATGSGKMYVNGTQEGTLSTSGNLVANTANLLLGKYSSDVFNGLIDQVRIYNYARTAAQIAWDYNRGGPVGWWKMDECQGGTANDASGNANNGTITIGATGTQSVLGTCSVGVGSTAAWGNGSVGKYSSSLNFDGTDDYVDVGSNSSLNLLHTTPFSVSSWVYNASAISGTLDFRTILARRHTTTTNGYGWFYGVYNGAPFNGDNHVEFAFYGGLEIYTVYTVPTNQWIHLAISYDGNGTGTIYINHALAFSIPDYELAAAAWM